MISSRSLFALCICLLSFCANAATRTWTGATSANWSDSSNWSPDGAPSSNDALVFPSNASHTAMVNDLAPGFAAGPIVFDAVYSISGNPITLAGDINAGPSGVGKCTWGSDVSVKLGAPISAAAGITNVFNGVFDVNGYSWTSSTVTLNGQISGSGAIHAPGLLLSAGGNFIGDIDAAVNILFALPNANIIAGSSAGPSALLSGNATVGIVNMPRVEPCCGPNGGYGVLHTKAFTVTQSLRILLNPGGGSDAVAVTGSVNVSGATLLVDTPGAPADGQVFTIIDNDGADPINGTFAGLPEGATVTAGSRQFASSYHGGDGNDVTLTTVASPNTWAGTASNLWSIAANWSSHVPIAGEALIFPVNASHTAMVNDLPAGFVAGPMTFNADGYSLSGNALTLGSDIATTLFTCSADVNIASSIHLGRVTFNGAVNGGGSIAGGFLTFAGGGAFNGTIAGTSNVISTLPAANFVGSSSTLSGHGTVGTVNVGVVDPCCGITGGFGVLHTKGFTVSNSLVVALNPSGTSDAVQVTGSVNVGGATLNLTIPSGAAAPGQSFTIIDNDGTDAVTGTFAGLPEGALVNANLRLTYAGGDGNDVVLTSALNTATTLVKSATTTFVSQPLTLTATVTAPGATPTGGIVTFVDGATTLGSAPLVNGTAQFTTSSLSAGAHSFVAMYSGANAYFGSSSPPVTHNVDRAATTTLLAVDHTTVKYGQALTFSVEVSSAASGAATLRVDGLTYATTTLTNGEWTGLSSDLGAGTHSIVASYAGNSSLAPSVSVPVNVTIGKVATTITAHADRNPAPAGSDVTLIISVTSETGAATNGTIDVNGAIATLVRGAATVIVRGLLPGDHDLPIAYSGSENFNASTATLPVTIGVPQIIVDDAHIVEGDSGTSTAHVALRLSGPSSQSIRVSWRTIDGSATAGEDYLAANGILTFAPGETAKTIDVAVIGDLKPELDESFAIELSSAENASLLRVFIGVVIQNDDATFKKTSFTYGTTSNGPLTMDLYSPLVGAAPHPVVIWIPGFMAYDADDTLNRATRETSRGYAVAVPRYRGASVTHFPAQFDDLRTAIRFLRANAAQYAIDAQHIAVWGEGTGAHLASLLGTADDATASVQAVVDWSGAADLLTLNADADSCSAIDHNGADSAESQLLGCALQACTTSAVAASPLAYASAGDPPFLIMHGTADCDVAAAQRRN